MSDPAPVRVLLSDYGEVISAPLDEGAITRLAALADQPRTVFLERYWRHRAGCELALLSNAPEPLAAGIDALRWSREFGHRYYSCRLRAAKPGPRAYELVLHDLGAEPDQVLFIDDRAENIRSARDLGLRTITFTSPDALDQELHRALGQGIRAASDSGDRAAGPLGGWNRAVRLRPRDRSGKRP